MKILILRETGSIGKHLVSQALEMGHEVTALIRHPGKLSTTHKRLRVIQGDVLGRDAMEQSVARQEAVVYSIGATVRESRRLSFPNPPAF